MVLFLDRVSNIDETVKTAFIEITQNKKKKKEKVSDATPPQIWHLNKEILEMRFQKKRKKLRKEMESKIKIHIEVETEEEFRRILINLDAYLLKIIKFRA